MASFFRVHMLPARQGDCLWIEYGDDQTLRRVLIDGGTQGTFPVVYDQLKSLPEGSRQFELLVVTHIDSDHIGGVLPLLKEDDSGTTFGDVWFNGWRHLPGSGLEEFGPVQGEELTARLDQGDLAWNRAFAGKSVCLPANGPLPVIDLLGGLRLTLLSPTAATLRELRPVWEEECRKAGLVPGLPTGLSHPVPAGLEAMGPVNLDQLAAEPYTKDGSEANGSSIALLAEFAGKRILLAGDAHTEELQASLDQLAAQGERLYLDAFKLPHHGSKYNLSQTLLDKIDCKRYLFSTDGTLFKHPDQPAVARVIKFGGGSPELIFNYRTEYNELWDNPRWMEKYGYSVRFPEQGQAGLVVEI